MSLPDAFRIVQVWRNSFHAPGNTPTFTGAWFMGDWKKERWSKGHTVVEVREIPFSRIYSTAFAGKHLIVRSNDLLTRKSRRSSRFFTAASRQPYDGTVHYNEALRDD